MLSGAEKPLCPPHAFSKYPAQYPSFFLSSSSLKFCCDCKVGVIVCIPAPGGGFLLVSLWKQQFAGVHGAVPGIRPFPHTPGPVQPVDLRWHHAVGAWSEVCDGHVQRWPSHYSGCPSMLCSCVSSSKEPNQQRVKRWAFGIDEVLKDPVGREQFLKFLESEFSSENLRSDQGSPAFLQY